MVPQLGAAGVLAAAAIAWPVSASSVQSNVRDIDACWERALPDRARVQALTLEVHHGEGRVSRAAARIYFRRSDDGLIALHVRFVDPPHQAGVALLARERPQGEPEFYTYLPALRQTRRVSAKIAAGSLLGSDFSYEDLAAFQGLRRAGRVQRLADTVLDGRAVHVLETRPDEADVPYERIVAFVEAKRCVPLRTEFYNQAGTLRKLLTIDPESVAHVDGYHVPTHATMRDLETGSHTEVRVEKPDPTVRLRDHLFEPAGLGRAGH